jgi:glycosyltransferase involved in cell wall biosynthesis
MKISLVICVFNEEENIQPLSVKIIDVLKDLNFEAIFVDDGSADSTCKRIREINDKRFVLVEFRKNYGQSTAIQAGIDQAKGEFIVTLDGDLQNDPADIPMMVEMAESGGWDLVAGVRINRKDGFLLRKIPSQIANSIIRNTTGILIRDYGCTLKVFRNEIAKDIRIYGELHRFIPVLVALEGGTITQVEVKHYARVHGKSKYGLGRTFKVLSDLLFMLFMKKYLQKPMHLFGGIGLPSVIIGILISLFWLIIKISECPNWGISLLIVGVMFVLFGILMITIGFMAEIQMRTYYESQNKKPYRIRKIEKIGS